MVAVIRLQDGSEARAPWSTRSPPAASRALEVTMTVPRAIELIERDRADAAGGVRARRRHRPRSRRPPAPAIQAGAQLHRRPGVQAGRHRGVPPATTCAAMPGCFSPTEILAAWEAGADVVKVFPATALGPGVLQGPARPAAAGEADAHRRRDASRTPATGSAPGAVAIGVGGGAGRSEAGGGRATTRRSPERAKRFVERVRTAAGVVRMSSTVKCVTFGEIMLRLEPAGIRAVLPVARARGRRSAAARRTSR
ncbi:MAG: hypothetical protein MZV64_72640 [Ignavibacteriales bacterium]|nr:hypothetical protein [Ignavibacteriales bacterium]